jgi:hypothetical protein
MKKTFLENPINPFPPPHSTFPMKGKLKLHTSTPLPLKSKKNKKSKCTLSSSPLAQ